MLVLPNAKINLGLYITSKRADGYHNLETLFLPIASKDALEIVPAADGITSMTTFGLPIQGDEKSNLVWKAWELIASAYPNKVQPIKIVLQKAIPMGAGLGGGSSDGAFMLRLLNDYFKLQITEQQLLAMALQLGSDCSFFIKNIPCFASGRGEQLLPVCIPDLSAYQLLLVHPEIHISTAQAFSKIQPQTANYDLRKLADLPLEEWKTVIVNDFEKGVLEQYPDLALLKQDLYKLGAIYVAMSGTGSSFYAFVPKNITEDSIAATLKYKFHLYAQIIS